MTQDSSLELRDFGRPVTRTLSLTQHRWIGYISDIRIIWKFCSKHMHW